MKAAIVYATKYGCTKKCAEMLKTYLNGEADILSAKSDKISLAQYDTVFIGGSVYMGKIQKEIGSQDKAIAGGYKFVFCHSEK